jgi:hypothetical protein
VSVVLCSCVFVRFNRNVCKVVVKWLCIEHSSNWLSNKHIFMFGSWTIVRRHSICRSSCKSMILCAPSTVLEPSCISVLSRPVAALDRIIFLGSPRVRPNENCVCVCVCSFRRSLVSRWRQANLQMRLNAERNVQAMRDGLIDQAAMRAQAPSYVTSLGACGRLGDWMSASVCLWIIIECVV